MFGTWSAFHVEHSTVQREGHHADSLQLGWTVHDMALW